MAGDRPRQCGISKKPVIEHVVNVLGTHYQRLLKTETVVQMTKQSSGFSNRLLVTVGYAIEAGIDSDSASSVLCLSLWPGQASYNSSQCGDR